MKALAAVLPPLPGGEGAGSPPIASSIMTQTPSQPASSGWLAPQPACVAQDGRRSAWVLAQELSGIIDLAVPHKPDSALDTGTTDMHHISAQCSIMVWRGIASGEKQGADAADLQMD